MDFFPKVVSPAAILLLAACPLWGQAPAGQGPAPAVPEAPANVTPPAAPKLLQPGQTSQKLDWRFAPPNASMLGGIELQKLLHSPLFAELLTASSVGNPNATMLVGVLQSMLMQVERIQFAAVDNGTNTPDGVLLVTGTLDDGIFQLLSSSARQGAQGQNSTQPGKEPWDWRRIDPTTVLFGVASMLDGAQSRLGSPEVLPLEQGVQLNHLLSPNQDLWVSGLIPNAPATAGVNKQIDGFALGLHFADNLEVEAAAVVPNANQAQALIGLLQAMIALQASQFAGQLETSTDNKIAHARLSLTAADVLQLIAAGQAMNTNGAPTGSGTDPSAGPDAGAAASPDPGASASPEAGTDAAPAPSDQQ